MQTNIILWWFLYNYHSLVILAVKEQRKTTKRTRRRWFIAKLWIYSNVVSDFERQTQQNNQHTQTLTHFHTHTKRIIYKHANTHICAMSRLRLSKIKMRSFYYLGFSKYIQTHYLTHTHSYSTFGFEQVFSRRCFCSCDWRGVFRIFRLISS